MRFSKRNYLFGSLVTKLAALLVPAVALLGLVDKRPWVLVAIMFVTLLAVGCLFCFYR